ncbi:hypothetical protein LE190_07440 [Massilia oculi]|uniref:Uncharacterized protein n=1 Tax=Massilia hydrophila TaxID=3044279 RepID=A0ABS7Y9U5_9BURK|nr:hypothetical protein [Massilia oculi]MCA1855757.1 hypothetical protein [Massilia oculi]
MTAAPAAFPALVVNASMSRIDRLAGRVARGWTRVIGFVVVVNKFVYKLVVIVNAHHVVDNKTFLHMLNGLRSRQATGQGLCSNWTKREQNSADSLPRLFCTFDPVDIPAVFHSRWM